MGIGKGGAILLMKEALRRPFTGAILTLGKQEVQISFFQLMHYSKLSNFSSSISTPLDLYSPLEDQDFFSFLGFSGNQSLDYSNFEGASIQFDLNSGEIPDSLRESFDVIYDGGTIEHIFHLPNAFKSLVSMLKPGGRLIHLNPSSNHLEHSFFMFSPTFFHDYYTANNFEINYIQLVRYTHSFDYNWIIYDYTPGCFDGTGLGSGGLDKSMYAVHTVVTKTASSTSHVIPNQSMYSRDMWVQPPPPKKSRLLHFVFNEKTLRKWKQRFKATRLYPMYIFWKHKLRKHGVPLKFSDRF